MAEKRPGDAAGRRPYIAILLYRTTVDDGSGYVTHSEDVVLIHEHSIEGAKARAETMGHDEETSYSNQYGQTVNWEFLGVADVRDALYDDLDSDTALYTRRFDRLSDYESLFSFSPRGGRGRGAGSPCDGEGTDGSRS